MLLALFKMEGHYIQLKLPTLEILILLKKPVVLIYRLYQTMDL